MNGFTYLVTPVERLAGEALAPAALRPLRAPLLALAGAVFLVGVSAAMQHARLAAAMREGDALASELVRTHVAVTRVRAIEADRNRLLALNRRVQEIERSGAVHAGELAAIGNGIPADAWISSIRVDAAGYAIEGRAARLASIGTTMDALARVMPSAHVRLRSVREDDAERGVIYAIGLEVIP